METEEQIEKLYYTIGEAREILQTSHTTIRYWIKEFEVPVPRLWHHGYARKFTKENIETLKEIKRLLKVELYTIQGTKRQLNMK